MRILGNVCSASTTRSDEAWYACLPRWAGEGGWASRQGCRVRWEAPHQPTPEGPLGVSSGRGTVFCGAPVLARAAAQREATERLYGLELRRGPKRARWAKPPLGGAAPVGGAQMRVRGDRRRPRRRRERPPSADVDEGQALGPEALEPPALRPNELLHNECRYRSGSRRRNGRSVGIPGMKDDHCRNIVAWSVGR